MTQIHCKNPNIGQPITLQKYQTLTSAAARFHLHFLFQSSTLTEMPVAISMTPTVQMTIANDNLMLGQETDGPEVEQNCH